MMGDGSIKKQELTTNKSVNRLVFEFIIVDSLYQRKNAVALCAAILGWSKRKKMPDILTSSIGVAWRIGPI